MGSGCSSSAAVDVQPPSALAGTTTSSRYKKRVRWDPRTVPHDLDNIDAISMTDVTIPTRERRDSNLSLSTESGASTSPTTSPGTPGFGRPKPKEKRYPEGFQAHVNSTLMAEAAEENSSGSDNPLTPETQEVSNEIEGTVERAGSVVLPAVAEGEAGESQALIELSIQRTPADSSLARTPGDTALLSMGSVTTQAYAYNSTASASQIPMILNSLTDSTTTAAMNVSLLTSQTDTPHNKPIVPPLPVFKPRDDSIDPVRAVPAPGNRIRVPRVYEVERREALKKRNSSGNSGLTDGTDNNISASFDVDESDPEVDNSDIDVNDHSLLLLIPLRHAGKPGSELQRSALQAVSEEHTTTLANVMAERQFVNLRRMMAEREMKTVRTKQRRPGSRGRTSGRSSACDSGRSSACDSGRSSVCEDQNTVSS